MNKAINAIIERNKRVETDKSWETSITRRVIIAVMVYLIMLLFLWMANIPNIWVNALIPSLAFILSTLTMPFFKKLWAKYIYKK